MTLNPFLLLVRPKPPDPAQNPFSGVARDPFDAVPHKNELAEAREDSRSCLQVRLRMKPVKKIAAFLARRAGFHHDVRVDLDAHGSFYWSLVDGRRDLRAIEKKLRRKFELEVDESKKATLLFTKMLMLRHLIRLEIDQSSPATKEVRRAG